MVVNSLDVGGLERVVISLIRHLDPSLFRVSLICLNGPGKLFSEVDLPSDRCLILDKSSSIDFRLIRFDPRMILRIRRFLASNHVELVHAHNAGPLIYGGFAARSLLNRPVMVYSEHNQIYSASESSRRKFQYYVRLADHIIAVSNDLLATLTKKTGVTRPISVIHNGIDGNRFSLVDGSKVRQELGVLPDEFLVGTGVVLSKQKGIAYLLDAAKTVVEREPRIRFAIAGDGPLRAELARQAERLGLTNSVRFLGYRSDIPQFVSALDLYVLPSLWEGLPLALLEAMAIGKPMIATTVGGNPEVVIDGKNGYLVPPRNPTALAEAVLRGFRDKDFASRAQLFNRQTFASQFSEAAMVRAHERLFAKLCDG